MLQCSTQFVFFLGSEKLGLDSARMKQLVLEEDGTEIDSDYFPFVKANTVLMILVENEQWNNQLFSKTIFENVLKNSYFHCL
jgi:hypothetical protein